ncbi:MAG: Fibronectin type domain protein [Candidatus Krumholzibacteriota bacterium]|jgi:fibronectin type 3 domain-containing protein|nr:Fibronectin type domain protein [Candidatus Krumholzibacteriota bacterium]
MSSKSRFLAVFVLFAACLLFTGCVSDSVTPVEDEAPVLPPTNVTAAPSDLNKVTISWDPNSHPQLQGYHVYRVESDTQDTERLTANPISNVYYSDMTARRGIGYQYRVTALTKSGKESAYASVPVMLQADDHQNHDRQF